MKNKLENALWQNMRDKSEEMGSLLKFEWDEEKNQINKMKHKISFEIAVHVFCDPHYIEMYDFEHSVDEDRYIAIGMVKKYYLSFSLNAKGQLE